MKSILAGRQRALLERFARPGVLVALDFDGTLAPIVAHRRRARMRVGTRRALARLARLCPVVVISGRARADAARRVAGLGVRAVIGNHGAEPAPRAAALRARVRRWSELLRGRLAGLAGVTLEDKRYSLTVHYRQAHDPRAARRAILAALEGLRGVRLIGGKFVLNLVARTAPDKGRAVERERRRLRCGRVIYVGDDDTDEDVFALATRRTVLAVRVGASRTSRAEYCVREQLEIDELLAAIARALACSTRPRGAENGRKPRSR